MPLKNNPSLFEMNDYDAAIDFLTKNPNEIVKVWFGPSGHIAGCLFKFCKRNSDIIIPNVIIGCLTTIRGSKAIKVLINNKIREDIAAEIRSDTRIPLRPENIKPENLFAFKEWQEKLDLEAEKP